MTMLTQFWVRAQNLQKIDRLFLLLDSNGHDWYVEEPEQAFWLSGIGLNKGILQLRNTYTGKDKCFCFYYLCLFQERGRLIRTGAIKWRIEGLLGENDLEMSWVGAIMTKVRSYPGICIGWQRKTTRNTSDVVCTPALIQVGHARITCQKRYLLSKDLYFDVENSKSQVWWSHSVREHSNGIYIRTSIYLTRSFNRALCVSLL
jgi:hypothetical protein